MKLGMVGLGRMGMNMSQRLMQDGHQIVAFNRTADKVEEISKQGALKSTSLKDLVGKLPSPRIVWLMLPAGAVVQAHIQQLKPLLSEGDIIVDGGNTHYKDDLHRAEELASVGIHYIDAGVSGGIWGLKNGYCLMAGGDEQVCRSLEPVFKSLAPAEGYLYCGPAGAGHFVKMIHNGIEYGMMQAYAEGFALLAASPYAEKLDYAKVSHTWNQGSVISSWLLELLENVFHRDPNLDQIIGYVEDSGEGRWTVQQALESAVSAPVITLSLFRRFQSRRQNAFEDRLLAALRREFGGHEVVAQTKA